MSSPSLADALERDGFAIAPNLIDVGRLDAAIAALECAGTALSARGGDVFGARNLLMVPAIRALAFASEITALVEAVLGAPGRPVRGIFFDKTAQANWPVPWHQDLTIALAERRQLPGWTQWSIKSGVHHVQPPTAFLERMITLRLHVDDCDEDNGPLRVLPGSHRMGRLTREKISELTNGCREIICTAPKGSALVMRPLLLHASSPAKRPRHGRVIHLEFAMTDSLPGGLSWLPLG